MKASLFRHELRAALREARWLVPIPSLVLVLGVAISHRLWISHSGNPTGGGFSETQRQARVLLETVWPYVAWIVPYAIFKFPDLKKPDAFWRTTPMPAGIVFGSRVLLAVIFTVILPALLFGAALLATFPETTAEQTLIALRNQWIYFAYGAFAALVLRGHKGVLLVLLMGLTWKVTDRVTSGFYYSNPLTPLMPGDLFGLLAPILLLILIRYSTKKFHIKSWVGVTGALVILTFLIPQQWVFSLYSEETVAREKEKRPVAHSVFWPLSPQDSRAEVLRERALDGSRVDPKLSYFARAKLAAETGNYNPNVGNIFGRSNCAAYTQMGLPDQNIPWIAYEGGVTATMPDAERTDRRAILRDYSGMPPYDYEDRARAQMGALAGDSELQVLTRTESPDAPRTWDRLVDLKHNNEVVFYLSEKEKRKAGVAVDKNHVRQIPPHLFVDMALMRHTSPRVILRCPAATGGMMRTGTELVAVGPMVLSQGYGRSEFNTIKRRSLLSPVFPGLFSDRYLRGHYQGEYQVVLINRKRHQAVTSFVSSWSGSDNGDEGSVTHMINSIEVREVAPLIDQGWIKEAEIIVYAPGDDATDWLHVEFTAADGVQKSR